MVGAYISLSHMFCVEIPTAFYRESNVLGTEENVFVYSVIYLQKQ